MSDSSAILEMIKEEYNRKWDYVRHTEAQREKFIQWYFLIVGAILAFLFKDVVNVESVIGKQRYIICISFCVLYSLFLLTVLLFQKKNYKYYTDRIMQLEKEYCDLNHNFPSNRYFTAFRTIFSSIALTSSGLFFTLIYVLSGNITYGVLGFIVYFSLAVGATFLPLFKH